MLATTVHDKKRREVVEALSQEENDTYECYQCRTRFEQHHTIRLQGDTWWCDNIKRCGVAWKSSGLAAPPTRATSTAPTYAAPPTKGESNAARYHGQRTRC